jgi:hypothetical protein
MSTQTKYVCDHCGAECTDKFEFSLFGKWARKDAQYIPDNVHGCTREHTILAVAKILGIGVDGSARELLEALRSELKNTQFKLQKFEDANKVNLAQIDTLKKELGEARERISELESRPDAAEVLRRVRRHALDFARPHGIDECSVVDVDTITSAIADELASLTGPKKPTKPAVDHVHELGSCTHCDASKPQACMDCGGTGLLLSGQQCSDCRGKGYL